MTELALVIECGALALLLAASAFFSIAETSMIALNRYRLRHLAARGHGGARRAELLLRRTDSLLATILIGNNLANVAAATLASVIGIQLFGEGKTAYAVSTLVISFLLIVFAEITPKVIGATYPERVALPLAYLLTPLIRVLRPAVWMVNVFARPLLKLAGIRPDAVNETPKLTPEEIRTLVLESSSFMPKKHVAMLINLFDLDRITVGDIMVPRARIEVLRLTDDHASLTTQLVTSYHMRLPVVRNGPDEVIGILHLRKVLGALRNGSLSREAVETLLAEPYFVPASTPVFRQLQYFQDNRERIGLVVDEYGDLMGLITLEDIIEEIIGKFTTSLPGPAHALVWDAEGYAAADGAMTVREINRALGLHLPTAGPRTLNGLILEHLRDIPEADVSIRIGDVTIEITHAQGRSVKSVRLTRPNPSQPARLTN